MEERLIMDGSSASTPCFYDPSLLEAPSPPPVDLSKIPANYFASPIDNPRNDFLTTQALEQAAPMIKPISPFPPDACRNNPPGFTCGPLPVLPGHLVKCVPRLDQTDLNQLSARVLPLTVSRANGQLDNPARGDPRFEVFPTLHKPAYSRCCGLGTLSPPTSTKPLMCTTPPSVKEKLMPAEKQHIVNPMYMGFRDPKTMAQLRLTDEFLKTKKIESMPYVEAREKMWKDDSKRLLKLFSAGPSDIVVLDAVQRKANHSRFL